MMPRYRVTTCDSIPWGYIARCARNWRCLAIMSLLISLAFLP